MNVDYLIVGQGISGTMLAWYLKQAGKSIMVIDANNPNSASRVSAGVINPVTGRRFAETWMIDTIMPFAADAYRRLGLELNETIVHSKSIIHFFPGPDERIAFVEKLQLNDTFLHSFPDQNHFNAQFNYDFGCGEIRPAHSIDVSLLLKCWRQKLIEHNELLDEAFDHRAMTFTDDIVHYKDLVATKIIFCDGMPGAENPWFNLLPFALNKGEMLVIHCPDLNPSFIFKRGLTIVPQAIRDHFWVGASYQWTFDNVDPSPAFRERTEALLESWLRLPFSIVDHRAAVRPATLERRPFVGLHPVHSNIGILNGMGTKGASLAPFFASQLAQHLVHGLPITPEADVKRFTRILSK